MTRPGGTQMKDRRRQWLIGALALTITSCSSGEQQGSASTSSSASQPTSSPPTTSARATPTSTPKPTPASEAPWAKFTIKCKVGANYLTFATYQSAWSGPSEDDCEATPLSGYAYNEVQSKAVHAAYGQVNLTKVKTLYGLCAELTGAYTTKIISAEQAAEARGMLLLCPEHPNAPAIQASVAAFNQPTQAPIITSAAATTSWVPPVKTAIAEGKYAADGHHLIGSEIQPGTWQSVGTKVTDCYWELSDAQGEIIDNNFISVAPQFTIQVPDTAAGFTNTGCEFQWIG